MVVLVLYVLHFFFFNDTATTEIYTLSLHDALPICLRGRCQREGPLPPARHPGGAGGRSARARGDRKSTRLNSSHTVISYAVFCLKKKKRSLYLQMTSTHSSPSTQIRLA